MKVSSASSSDSSAHFLNDKHWRLIRVVGANANNAQWINEAMCVVQDRRGRVGLTATRERA